jgi:hypothetical protein
MNKPFNIEIQGLDDINVFISRWSPQYSYSNEDRYLNHIKTVLDSKDSFVELFKWKNGTGDVIYVKKMNVVLGFWDKVEVLRELKREFDWDLFEREFEPQKNSPIWKLFLLHLVNPNKFPIFDQHVYRSFHFFETGLIEKIPSSSKLKYQIYKNEYLGWFNNIQEEFNILPKEMDKSFFSYGQMLKRIMNYPIQIHN